MAADHRQAGSLWTPEEDVILLRHVAKYGTKHWGYLQTSGALPHRDQKACCNRFILLKRKFFQARAKGQRLSFPVVPQPEGSSSLRSPSNSSSTRVSPSSSIGVSRLPNFKRSANSGAFGGGSSNFRVPDADLVEASVSLGKSFNEASSGGFTPERPIQRNLENLPEAGISHIREQHQLPALACPSAKAPVRVKDETNAPQTSVRASPSMNASSFPQPLQASLESLLDSIPAAQRGSQSATWQCFNAADVETLVSEGFSVDDLPLPAETVKSGIQSPAPASGPGPCTPDALLEQMAAAPVQTMFGVQSLLANGLAGAGNSLSQADVANIWESPAACLDLWDLMRTAASV